ncbi:hypothetical protein SLE2022_308980 [Rubroshorea leprosula]
MMKDLLFHQHQQQQQQQVLEENMSNLTSASGEASVSSGQYFAPPPQQSQPQPPLAKKKRNLPGNPDPDAEVISLSPKTLLATNRFVCEICKKGFQRDQNLQLHRRGHNLPWKLKQRTNKEVIRKKVYVCPEPSCVHHDPSRALGDLTGIKKHFCRKHGEKKWKCEKCSKKYAVQSDWKAHSKTCGTREYRCDCGTLFSRRDSFITHRAFCDALAEESARANPLLSTQPGSSSSTPFNPQAFSVLKKEQQSSFNLLGSEIPPWLAPQPILGAGPGPPPPPPPLDHLSSSSSASIFSTTRLDHQFNHHDLSNPNPSLGGPTLPPYHPTVPSQPHMSATALLQKAAQMGATMSSNTGSTSALRPHQQPYVSVESAGRNNSTTPAGYGLNFTSREVGGSSFIHGLNPGGATNAVGSNSLILQEMVKSLSSGGTVLDRTSIHDEFGGVFMTSKKLDGSFGETLSKATATNGSRNFKTGGSGSGSGGRSGGGEHLTRDFLGLRAFSHGDILNIAGLDNCMNTSHEQHNQKPWQG